MFPELRQSRPAGTAPRRRKAPAVASLASLLAVVAVVAVQNRGAILSTFSSSKAGEAQVFFSPDGGCTDAVIAELGRAKKEVRVQAYSFTSTPIAKALADAAKRGVDVQVILDKSQRTEHYSSASFIANAGIPAFIDDKHAIAHNKVIVIDRETVITGSFNFTKAAETRNAENLLILHGSPSLAQRYADNWERHHGHSVPYARQAAKP